MRWSLLPLLCAAPFATADPPRPATLANAARIAGPAELAAELSADQRALLAADYAALSPALRRERALALRRSQMSSRTGP